MIKTLKFVWLVKHEAIVDELKGESIEWNCHRPWFGRNWLHGK